MSSQCRVGFLTTLFASRDVDAEERFDLIISMLRYEYVCQALAFFSGFAHVVSEGRKCNMAVFFAALLS